MISVTLLEVDIAGDPVIDLGANPGSALRGALYDAMRMLYDDNSAARSRHERDNPVAWLMRLEDDQTTGGKDVQRPWALRPPLTYTPERATFGLALYGSGQEYLGLFTSAIAAMGRLGVGRGRQRFRIAGVCQVDPLTYQRTPILDGTGKSLDPLRPSPSWDAFKQVASAHDQNRLSVQFLTPTRLISEGRLCHRPDLAVWAQRLLERLRSLTELYCEMPVWVPFPQLLAAAHDVTLVKDETRWVEAWSASRREGMMRPTSGFVGSAEYNGQVAELLPYLMLGQALQVGKNAVKGCGWYRLNYLWQ